MLDACLELERRRRLDPLRGLPCEPLSDITAV